MRNYFEDINDFFKLVYNMGEVLLHRYDRLIYNANINPERVIRAIRESFTRESIKISLIERGTKLILTAGEPKGSLESKTTSEKPDSLESETEDPLNDGYSDPNSWGISR